MLWLNKSTHGAARELLEDCNGLVPNFLGREAPIARHRSWLPRAKLERTRRHAQT